MGPLVRFQLLAATAAIGGTLLVIDHGRPEVPREVLTFQDATIDESSGLVDLGDTVLTVNDSGGDPVVYVVAKGSGQTVGRTTYTSDDVVDVEAIAAAPDGTVWVGDIGDNGKRRSSVAVYRLPRVEPGDTTVEATRYDLAYPDGARDAEALLVHPRTGRLYVVSKGLFRGEVYAAPRRLDPSQVNLLRPVGRAGGLVTDAAFLPDGRHALLRGYAKATLHDAGSWRSRGSMPLPDQQQGEGLAVEPDGRRVLVSSEGGHSAVLSVPLSEELQATLEPVAEPAAGPASGPASQSGGREDRGNLADDDPPAQGAVPVELVVGGAAGVLLLLVVALGLRAARLRAARAQSRSTT